MKPIREVYPNGEEDQLYFIVSDGDYNPLLKSFGYEILLKVDDHDYQGDSRLLFKDPAGKIGLLIFGWGSCSGCDALQACSSYNAIDQLRSRLHDSIQWFGSSEAALAYFETHDWEGDHSWHEPETHKFIAKSKELLAPPKGE